MREHWADKTVLITGVCGTVGRELLRILSDYDVLRIIGIDNDESGLFFVSEEYKHRPEIQLFMADVRDMGAVDLHMSGIDIVLHAAALKHVTVCERSPGDAVQTNILGTQNIIESARRNGIGRVLFTSTDKAVNPTNVMGTSKLMAERLMTAAHATGHEESPIFVSTRFGNVLGSRGSVIPIFKRQIRTGGPVTLTDPAMTRFVMTLEEACHLVLDSVFLAAGGEVFITKMPVAKIEDLADLMIQKSGRDDIEIKIVGTKPGEKLYEELMNEEETRRTVELEKYFSVLPAFTNIYREIDYEYVKGNSVGIERPYNSSNEPAMSRDELSEFLKVNYLIGEN